MGGEAGDQCSIFVSLSFSASTVLSSNGGDFSFFSSSIGLGELLLAAETTQVILKHASVHFLQYALRLGM